MKPIRIHKKVEKELLDMDSFTQAKLMELFAILAKGGSLGLPVSRPMPSVSNGAHELRVKSTSGAYRVFYFVKHKDALLVFHAFKKKTNKTPDHELSLAQKRLGEML